LPLQQQQSPAGFPIDPNIRQPSQQFQQFFQQQQAQQTAIISGQGLAFHQPPKNTSNFFAQGGVAHRLPGPPIQQLPKQKGESLEEAQRRFETECEFVQALANPHYLHYLAQAGYFKDESFVNYLKYLQYFKRSEYARTLKYPQCLFFLDCLQQSEFREAMSHPGNIRFVEDQQLLHWQHYLRKRMRLQQQLATI